MVFAKLIFSGGGRVFLPDGTGGSDSVPGTRGVFCAGGESNHRPYRPHLHPDSDRRDVSPATELVHHRRQSGKGSRML